MLHFVRQGSTCQVSADSHSCPSTLPVTQQENLPAQPSYQLPCRYTRPRLQWEVSLLLPQACTPTHRGRATLKGSKLCSRTCVVSIGSGQDTSPSYCDTFLLCPHVAQLEQGQLRLVCLKAWRCHEVCLSPTVVMCVPKSFQ